MAKRKDANGGRLPRFLGGKTRPVRILSIDGGGVRGILPAMVLAELERQTGRPTSELFDLVAGTSSGALVALSLLTPGDEGGPRFTAEEVAHLYALGSPRVFSRSVWHKIRAVGNLVDEKYPAKGIEGVLKRIFGERRLSEALCDTLITSYEIERRMPFFFRSRVAREREDYDFAMTEVVRAATAAPTFFEPAHIPTADGRDYYALIDGAVFAYNPGLCAYVEAQELYPDAKSFVMVSLGTGELTRRLAFESAKDWGAARWVLPLFAMMCDGDATMVNHTLEQMLGTPQNGTRGYYRFQVRLDTGNDDMDDASPDNLRTIKLLGEDMILKNRETIEELAAALVD